MACTSFLVRRGLNNTFEAPCLKQTPKRPGLDNTSGAPCSKQTPKQTQNLTNLLGAVGLLGHKIIQILLVMKLAVWLLLTACVLYFTQCAALHDGKSLHA